jgi:HlyD family secretion protein
MKRKALVSIILVVAIGIVAFIALRNKENGVKFKTAKITRGDIQAVVTATGTVNPVISVQVGTQVSGRIQYLYVDFNSPVKKGELIAQIDPAIFDAQFQQAKANVLNARANVMKAETSLLDAKRIFNRNKELLAEKVVSQSDFDTAETNRDAAEAQLSAAKAQVALSEAALKYAETNLFYTKIISPVDGIIISRNVDVGQTVAASFQTPTLFLIAQDLTKMQIDTNVSEADIGRVRVGEAVEFAVDAYPDVVFKGTVSQVRNAPITLQNVVTYDVLINVENKDLRLKPGMTANVSIIVATQSGILRIPNAALRFRPADQKMSTTEQKGPGVWIVENEKPKQIKVKTGISDGNNTELVQGELKEGQDVIIESIAKGKAENKTAGPGMMR